MLHGETEKVCKLVVYNRLVVIRKAGAQIRIIVSTKHGLNIDIIVASAEAD